MPNKFKQRPKQHPNGKNGDGGHKQEEDKDTSFQRFTQNELISYKAKMQDAAKQLVNSIACNLIRLIYDIVGII